MRPCANESLKFSVSMVLLFGRHQYITIVLHIATLSSLLNNCRYHFVLFFHSSRYGCSIWSFKSTLSMFMLWSQTTTGFDCTQFAVFTTTRISSLWYVEIIVTRFLSCQARTATSPECWPQCTPLFNFVFFTRWGTCFLLSRKVPKQSVSLDFKNRANFG
jgi:hypothetical protein